ncbi:MAG: porin family protein [Mangrovibacterium sp.]
MKKLIVIALILCAYLLTDAQTIGIRGGFNLANIEIESEGISISPDDRFGIHLGVVGEFPVGESLFINPGLLFMQKGFKMEGDGEDVKGRMNYLDIPVNALYKVDLTGAYLLLHAGPNFGFGLSGKEEYDGEEEDIEFGSDDDQLKSLDLGLNLGVGAEIQQFQVTLNYTLGLNNLSNYDEMDWKNKVLTLSLTYLLGK